MFSRLSHVAIHEVVVACGVYTPCSFLFHSLVHAWKERKGPRYYSSIGQVIALLLAALAAASRPRPSSPLIHAQRVFGFGSFCFVCSFVLLGTYVRVPHRTTRPKTLSCFFSSLVSSRHAFFSPCPFLFAAPFFSSPLCFSACCIFYFHVLQVQSVVWKQRNGRPIVGGVPVWSRNGAPSRKKCMVNGEMIDASNK